jgi:hypothetical protein
MVSRGKWLLIILHYVLATPFLCGAIYFLFEPWSVTPEDGLVPLSLQLKTNDHPRVRATFISKWNETHQLSLSFPAMTGDIDVDRIVDLAGKIGTQSAPPAFDFEWQVLRGETEVGHGYGKVGAIGSSSSGDHLRTLIFGKFPLRAGETYSATLLFGADFERFLKVTPLLQVRMANSGKSSDLAFARGVKFYCFIGLSALGLLLLSGGLRLQREVHANP